MSMLPSLVRYYGTLAPNGQPWEKSPYGVARVFLESIPRLQAREALVLVTAMAIGTGNMRKADADATLREWKRQAQFSHKAEKAQKVVGLEAMKKRLAAAGISLTVVPKRNPANG